MRNKKNSMFSFYRIGYTVNINKRHAHSVPEGRKKYEEKITLFNNGNGTWIFTHSLWFKWR